MTKGYQPPPEQDNITGYLIVAGVGIGYFAIRIIISIIYHC